MSAPHRNRLVYAGAVIAVIAAGLASRKYPHVLSASLGKYPGDALWALMVFLLIAFAMPRWRSAVVAALALLVSSSVEFSQLYQAPWINSIRASTLGHLVLGSTFNWHDLTAYTFGVVVGYLAEAVYASQQSGP